MRDLSERNANHRPAKMTKNTEFTASRIVSREVGTQFAQAPKKLAEGIDRAVNHEGNR